jgi:beta-lactamase regulating signal transducer with metallopeptidase domain
MTPTLITPDLMRNLALTLLHFLWQGLALAALVSVAMPCCRRASVRYTAGVVTLALMLIAPVITFLVISEKSPSHSWSNQIATSSARTVQASRNPATSSSNRQPLSLDLLPIVVEIWFAGVILLSLRAAGGFLVIERMRRKKSWPLSPELLARCLALQKRLGLERFIRYCECTWLEAPAVIGWMRPVVLVPVAALAGLSPEQLDAIITHELAHIKRLDAFVNVFQMVAETLLFYHPAVWWLSKRIRVERENCCDDVAISITGSPVEYARALTLMEEWRTAPSLALALTRSPLAERIMRLLGAKTWRSGMRSAGVGFSIVCLTLAFVAGNSLLGIVHPASAAQSSAPAPPTPQSTITPQPKPTPAASAKPKPALTSTSGEEPTGSGSYIDQMKAAGLDNLTPDELISLRVQGVTPEYVRGIRQQGFQPTADELVSLRVQSVTPEYIRDLRAQGLSLALDQIIGMKVQGITPAYVQQMRAEGLQVDADRLIGMKVQGATPEYVRDLKSLGLKFDADEVIAMRVQSVTPEYVRKIQALGLHPSVDELIAMRVQGVTPEWVRDLGAMGLKVDADRLISMRVQSISAEYVKALQDEGLKLDADELISAKVQGITPEFVEEARKHGFTHLDLDRLLELKRVGIFQRPQADI